ncbi:conserved hypothetical protein [Cupriavidus taiwanensis]|nr:conserved hypothetical protein [Cupriavidus taiwanensis]
MQWLCQWPEGIAMAKSGRCGASDFRDNPQKPLRFRQTGGSDDHHGETGVTVQVYRLDTRITMTGPTRADYWREYLNSQYSMVRCSCLRQTFVLAIASFAAPREDDEETTWITAGPRYWWKNSATASVPMTCRPGHAALPCRCRNTPTNSPSTATGCWAMSATTACRPLPIPAMAARR